MEAMFVALFDPQEVHGGHSDIKKRDLGSIIRPLIRSKLRLIRRRLKPIRPRGCEHPPGLNRTENRKLSIQQAKDRSIFDLFCKVCCRQTLQISSMNIGTSLEQGLYDPIVVEKCGLH